MKRLTDPSFRYYSSVNTDLRRTFARIRREQKNKTQPCYCGNYEETPSGSGWDQCNRECEVTSSN